MNDGHNEIGTVKISRASPELLAKLDAELGAVKRSIRDVCEGLKHKKEVPKVGRLARDRKFQQLRHRRQ